MPNITMRELFQAGVHFGHLTRFRDPSMSPHIHTINSSVHIINLESTMVSLKKALHFVVKLGSRGGKLLFVGTKRASRDAMRRHAERSLMPFVNYRWLGGTLTNYKTIKQSVKRLRELESSLQDGTLKHITKKEGLDLKRELEKLERTLGGVKEMGSLPDAIFVVDVGQESIAIKEANKLGIPVIGIVDTNNNPKGIDYPIAGNDDSMRAIDLYARLFADAILEGRLEQRGQVSSRYQEDFVEIEDKID